MSFSEYPPQDATPAHESEQVPTYPQKVEDYIGFYTARVADEWRVLYAADAAFATGQIEEEDYDLFRQYQYEVKIPVAEEHMAEKIDSLSEKERKAFDDAKAERKRAWKQEVMGDPELVQEFLRHDLQRWKNQNNRGLPD